MEKTLAEFAVGEIGQVLGFTRGADAYRQRLLAMGLLKGTVFQVTRVAPMGDPVEIRINSFSLSLRKDEAKTLKVKGIQR